jgi:hypothetical protein
MDGEKSVVGIGRNSPKSNFSLENTRGEKGSDFRKQNWLTWPETRQQNKNGVLFCIVQN